MKIFTNPGTPVGDGALSHISNPKWKTFSSMDTHFSDSFTTHHFLVTNSGTEMLPEVLRNRVQQIETKKEDKEKQAYIPFQLQVTRVPLISERLHPVNTATTKKMNSNGENIGKNIFFFF
jgi:hypothetical protein